MKYTERAEPRNLIKELQEASPSDHDVSYVGMTYKIRKS